MNKRNWLGLFAIAFALFFCSCSNIDPTKIFPKTTFDAPFPKGDKNLTSILGDHTVVKLDKDTFMLRITSAGNVNYVVDEKERDTVFVGNVSRYRGLYYFSHKINDTAYWIFAVKIKDRLIYGLNGALKETFCVDRQIEKGEHASLVKFINKDRNEIRLHPDKKEIRSMLTIVMDTLKADTLLAIMHDKAVPTDTAAITAAVDPEEYEFINKVYPNPAKAEVNVELQQPVKLIYYVSDITGKSVFNGQFNDTTNKVDVSSLPVGVYILTVSSRDNRRAESVKIIKD
ncbi:MAG TPA: T9SS type A sorting domain-containing protein [Bacteroidia bacterium]|jgi:hypothetical protein|nr:T9SS type A sorting domain-containing protein [Bacteroidia bacterium]